MRQARMRAVRHRSTTLRANGTFRGPDRTKTEPYSARKQAMSLSRNSAGHEVLNQSPPYVDVDLYGGDRPLQDAVAKNGSAQDAAALAQFGRHWGTAEMFELARAANENPPKLRTFDPRGFRLDTVEFHPAYHHFMRESLAAGLHASTWC